MISDIENILKLSSKKHTSKTLNIFWIGFIIYTTSFTLSTTTTVNYIICQVFQVIGILIFLPASIKLIKWNFQDQYLEILFTLYCLWQLIIIVRGIDLNYTNNKVLLFDAEQGIFRFFVPLVLLFPRNPLYYKKTIKVIVILGVLFLLYDMLFIKNLLDLDYENESKKFTYEHFVKILSVTAGLILLTFHYQKKPIKYFAIIVLIVSVFFAIIRARRALLFMTISPFLFSYILYVYSQKKNFLIMLFPFLFSLLILSFGIKSFYENAPGFFSLISDRATEDTRTGVEIAFYQDMKAQDWIIGKGINGKYYCPDIDLGSVTNYRDMIETDYLNIILKGGLISLVLLLLIAIPAIVKGLFYSNNLLSKGAAIWILLWVFELYPVTVNTFSLQYLTVWISIGICYSKVIRGIPERSLTEILSN